MTHSSRPPRRAVLALGLGALGTTGLSACTSEDQKASGPSASAGGSASASSSGSARATASAAAGLDTTSPASLTVLVNKRHSLDPQDWAPDDLQQVGSVQLRREAAEAARQMMAAAQKDGVALTPISGYRSYSTQVSTYDSWKASEGREAADHASARPGSSEHQTGLAVDFGGSGGCDLHPCFADTDSASWALEHAVEYGFVLRYPRGQQETTGYFFESWHYRYLGQDVARQYQASGAKTYEDFLHAGKAPDYAD